MRSDVTTALMEAAYANPGMRLGQLVTNAAKAAGWEQFDVFYCPDSQLRDGLKILAEEGSHGRTADR